MRQPDYSTARRDGEMPKRKRPWDAGDTASAVWASTLVLVVVAMLWVFYRAATGG